MASPTERKVYVEIGHTSTSKRTHVLVRAGKRWQTLCRGTAAVRDTPELVDRVTCNSCIFSMRDAQAKAG